MVTAPVTVGPETSSTPPEHVYGPLASTTRNNETKEAHNTTKIETNEQNGDNDGKEKEHERRRDGVNPNNNWHSIFFSLLRVLWWCVVVGVVGV
jgi:hypothetical protein